MPSARLIRPALFPLFLILSLIPSAATARADNTSPTIGAVSDSTTAMATAAIVNITVGDNETAAASLALTAASSDETLLPSGDIVFSGSGADRSATLTPAANQFGVTTVTLTVNDGSGEANATAETSFRLTVEPGDTGGVSIASVSPDNGAEGTSVTITGADLLGPGEDSSTTVWFKNLLGEWTPVSPEEGSASGSLLVTVPPGARSGPLAVDVNAGASRHIATAAFTVHASITSFSPSLGASGETVDIIGSGFTNTTQVLFHGVGPAVINDTGENFLSVVVPETATSGPITVITPDAGTVISTQHFIVGTNVPPTIGAVPDQATAMGVAKVVNFTVGDVETPAGSLTLTAQSSDQGLVPSGNIVFGGSGANRSVTITPAANQFGAVNIYLRVNDGSGAANQETETRFRFRISSGTAGSASISGFTPAAGRPGDILTIAGGGLLGPDDPDHFNTSAVYFKDYNGDWVQTFPEEGSTASSLIVIVPDTARSGPLTVTVDTFNLNTSETTHSIATSATNFTFNAVIDSFTPQEGGAGQVVDIEGVGFTYATSVLINGVSAPIDPESRSETQLSVTVPSNASTGPISVVTHDAGTAVSASPFSFVVNDPVAPTSAVVTSPANSALVASLAGGISGSAEDDAAGSGINRVDVVLHRTVSGVEQYWGFNSGTSVWEWSATERALSAVVATPDALSTTWSLNANLPAGVDLPNGQYRVHAVAWDRGDNGTAGADNTFHVNSDITPPTVSVTSPANGVAIR